MDFEGSVDFASLIHPTNVQLVFESLLSTSSMVPALVQLALDYYRTPLRYDHLSDMDTPLPRGFETLLDEMGHALAGPQIDETARLLSVAPRELSRAARFFIRHVLLDPAGDCYRWLGVSRSASPETIRRHYLMLMRMFHPDRVGDGDGAELAYASRINSAYRVLRDPAARREYDRGQPSALRQQRPSDPRLFFRASRAVILSERTGRLAWIGRVIASRPVVVAAALATCVGLGYLLVQHINSEPRLRLAGDIEDAPTKALPYYLRSQPTGGAAQERVAAVDAATGPTPSVAGGRILAGLEDAYRRGDAGAFAALFAPDARTSEGSGEASIQRTFAALLAHSISSWLSGPVFRWEAGADGGVVGRGRLALSDAYGESSGWHDSGGDIYLELMPGPDGYRISRLYYQLD